MITDDIPITRLARVAASASDRVAFGYIREGGTLIAQLNYGELCRQAGLAAAALRRRASPGDRILLTLPSGPAFAVALFGCWRAGMVPVPAYPPRPNRPHDRAFAIATDAGARLALVLDEARADTRQALEAGNIDCLDIGSLPADNPPPWFDWDAAALHMLQYTSGSTAEPKGVGIPAAALVANLAAMDDRVHAVPAGVTVSWLPHFHDFGLVAATIMTVWRGNSGYLISPTEFVKQPITWLRAMSRFRATDTQAPNFAFDLVARTVTPEDIRGLDLSSVRNVIIGAEPIRKAAMDRFLALVRPAGFDPNALLYGYGMAEVTLAASIDTGPPSYRAVNSDALDAARRCPRGWHAGPRDRVLRPPAARLRAGHHRPGGAPAASAGPGRRGLARRFVARLRLLAETAGDRRGLRRLYRGRERMRFCALATWGFSTRRTGFSLPGGSRT